MMPYQSLLVASSHCWCLLVPLAVTAALLLLVVVYLFLTKLFIDDIV